MRLIVAICITFFGIISIPFILLFIWLFVYICRWLLNKIFDCVFVGISSIKENHLKHAKFDYQCDKEIDELAKQREKENLPPIARRSFSNMWNAIVKWTDEHYIITAFIASFIVAIIFLLLTLCVNGYVTDKERVVLAFVGVLATFVVLTNHAQSYERIKEMEKMIEKTERNLKGTIDEQKKTNLTNLSNKIDEITQRNKRTTLMFVQACQDTASYNLAMELYSAVHETPNKTYEIQSKQGEKINATIEITKDLIKFSSTLKPFGIIPNNQIDTIDGKKYNYSKVRTIVLTLKQIDEENINQQKIV